MRALTDAQKIPGAEGQVEEAKRVVSTPVLWDETCPCVSLQSVPATLLCADEFSMTAAAAPALSSFEPDPHRPPTREALRSPHSQAIHKITHWICGNFHRELTA